MELTDGSKGRLRAASAEDSPCRAIIAQHLCLDCDSHGTLSSIESRRGYWQVDTIMDVKARPQGILAECMIYAHWTHRLFLVNKDAKFEPNITHARLESFVFLALGGIDLVADCLRCMIYSTMIVSYSSGTCNTLVIAVLAQRSLSENVYSPPPLLPTRRGW